MEENILTTKKTSRQESLMQHLFMAFLWLETLASKHNSFCLILSHLYSFCRHHNCNILEWNKVTFAYKYTAMSPQLLPGLGHRLTELKTKIEGFWLHYQRWTSPLLDAVQVQLWVQCMSLSLTLGSYSYVDDWCNISWITRKSDQKHGH